MKRWSHHGIVSISDVLTEVAEKLDLSKQFMVQKFFGKWESVVGPQIAARCTPHKLQGKTLILRVQDPAWSSELSHMNDLFLEKIQQMAGKNAVNKIRFELGPVVWENHSKPGFNLAPPNEEDVQESHNLIKTSGVDPNSSLGTILSNLIITCRRRMRTDSKKVSVKTE